MKTFWEKVAARLGFYQRRFLHDPLSSVPEFKGQLTWDVQSRDGNRARSYQLIADNLLFGVEYVVEGSVAGDIAEFGCMTGRTANVISAAMASFRMDRGLHLFDSFEGLPKSESQPDLSSIHVQDGTWGPGTCKGISASALRKNCEQYLKKEQIFIYEGWFSVTMPNIPKGTKFSMLHVDCDLYQSTMDVLDYVFAHKMLSPGAMILFDDWYCNHSSNQHGERKAWQELSAKYKISAENLGPYSWGGHKFIVQDYAV